MTKKRKAPTRGGVYQSEQKNEQNKGKKNRLIYKCLSDKTPRSRREISETTGIEICSLCNPLLQMVERGVLRIAYTAPCPISKNRVYHYQMREGVK